MIGSRDLNLLPASGAYFPSQIPGPVTRGHGITPMAPRADRSSAFVSISPQPPSRFPTRLGTCLPLKSSPYAPASFLVLPSPNPCPHLPPPSFQPIMDSTGNRPSPLRVATVVSFYMFAALVVCRIFCSPLHFS